MPRRVPHRVIPLLALAAGAGAAVAWLGADRSLAQDPEPAPEDDFLWAYPLVVTARTVGDLPRNELVWGDDLPDPADHAVPRPNPDVVYAVAALDLAAGPVVLEAPDLPDRYWSVQLMDPWTETVGYVGTRATEGNGGRWLLAGPDFDGTAPPDAQLWRMPSTGMVLLVRLGVAGPDDLAAALTLRDRFALEASAPPPPPPGSAGPPWLAGADGVAFWDEVGDALAWASPAPGDEARVDGLAALGVGPGLHPSVDADEAARAALEEAVTTGVEVLAAALEVRDVPPWTPSLALGTYDGDVLLRAVTARTGWGAHVPEEAVYAAAALAGPTTLRFGPDERPPVDAFWSLTVYDGGGSLVANEWDRYSLRSDHPWVVPAADGSLTLTLSPTPPAEGTDDWLPIPEGPATVVLRLYLPGPTVLDGSWSPPPLVPLAVDPDADTPADEAPRPDEGEHPAPDRPAPGTTRGPVLRPVAAPDAPPAACAALPSGAGAPAPAALLLLVRRRRRP